MANTRRYVIIEGEQARRIVGSNCGILRPICSYRECSFRLSLEDNNGESYVSEGKAKEIRLISAYRGMKILEGIVEFPETRHFLDSCLIAGRPDKYIPKEWIKQVNMVEAIIGKEKRDKILTLVPENLDRIIETLENAELDFDRTEILEEYQSKTIPYTPKVEELLDEVVAEIVGKR